MNQYIPDAGFDINDEPVGDKRWWFQEIYRRNGTAWWGAKPDQFSPHTRTEELAIEVALLTGKIPPRNDHEANYLNFIGGVIKSQRPTKKCACKRCGNVWVAKGWPAGSIQVSATRIDGKRWLFPNICLACDDLMLAKPEHKPREISKEKTNDPYN